MKKFFAALLLISALFLFKQFSLDNKSFAAECNGLTPVDMSVSPTSGAFNSTYTVTVNWPSGVNPSNDPYFNQQVKIAAFDGDRPVTNYTDASPSQGTEYKISNLQTDTDKIFTIRLVTINPLCNVSNNTPQIQVSGTAESSGQPIQAGKSCNPALQSSGRAEDKCASGSSCQSSSDGSFQCTCSPNDPDGNNACANGTACIKSGSNFFCESPQVDQEEHEGPTVKINPNIINEKRMRSVTLTLGGLKDTDYYLCTKPSSSDMDCVSSYQNNLTSKNENFILVNKDTTTITLCGNGETRVKNDCQDNRDYFHGGNTYGVVLFEKDNRSPLDYASFYVTRYYPTVVLNEKVLVSEGTADRVPINDPDNKLNNSGIDMPVLTFSRDPYNMEQSLKVQIRGARPREDKKERNDYQIVLEAQNYKYKEEECVTVSSGDNGNYRSVFAVFGQESDDPVKTLGPGTYLLKINDRINAGGSFFRKNDCQGGFTYYHIYFDLERKADNTFSIRIRDVQIDPNETDIKKVEKSFNPQSDSPLPCAEYDEVTETCLKINIPVFGIIGTKPIEFLKTLGQGLLALASIAAFTVLIYAGYEILTSRGDKEKVAHAREIITSAVTGLIFIILSISILQIIGVDILQIPGFTR